MCFSFHCYQIYIHQELKNDLEQRSVVKVLVAEKCKPCKIYRGMCDVYEGASFILKNVYKKANHEMVLRTWIEKAVHEVKTHRLSGKQKIRA